MLPRITTERPRYTAAQLIRQHISLSLLGSPTELPPIKTWPFSFHLYDLLYTYIHIDLDVMCKAGDVVHREMKFNTTTLASRDLCVGLRRTTCCPPPTPCRAGQHTET